jgi:hypothetical protein
LLRERQGFKVSEVSEVSRFRRLKAGIGIKGKIKIIDSEAEREPAE